MTLEAGGAEQEPSQALGKGKTLRLEPRGRGRNVKCGPREGCSGWGKGLLAPPQVPGRRRTRPGG